MKVQKNLRISEELNTRIKKVCAARGGISETDLIVQAIENDFKISNVEARHFRNLSLRVTDMEATIKDILRELYNIDNRTFSIFELIRAQNEIIKIQHERITKILAAANLIANVEEDEFELDMFHAKEKSNKELEEVFK
jgi:DNA replication protein DnaD